MSRSMKKLIDSGIAGAFLVPETDEDEVEVRKALKALDMLLTERDLLAAKNNSQTYEITMLRNELSRKLSKDQRTLAVLKELTGKEWQICDGCGRPVPALWSIPFCGDQNEERDCHCCFDRPINS